MAEGGEGDGMSVPPTSDRHQIEHKETPQAPIRPLRLLEGTNMESKHEAFGLYLPYLLGSMEGLHSTCHCL